MSNYHMYLVPEDNIGNIVDDVVVSAENEVQARKLAKNYFAKHGAMDGYTISPEWGTTPAEPDVRASDGAGSRTISF